MFTAASSLPFSFYSLMIDEEAVVTSSFSHRPDRLASEVINGDFFVEVMCNEASNVSALSLEDGVDYLLPSLLFQKYFLGV